MQNRWAGTPRHIQHRREGERHPEAYQSCDAMTGGGAITLCKHLVDRWKRKEAKRYEHYREVKLVTRRWKGIAGCEWIVLAPEAVVKFLLLLLKAMTVFVVCSSRFLCGCPWLILPVSMRTSLVRATT